MTTQKYSLSDLGWSAFQLSQLSVEELQDCQPLRVTEIHRNAIDLLGEDGAQRLPLTRDLAEQGVAVGDWILCQKNPLMPLNVLSRKTLLQRRGAGEDRAAQLIAANVDTLFIVSSCNADFNPARLERYLALALQAEVEPVLVLTKADLCDDPTEYTKQARELLRDVMVETLNAKSETGVHQLLPWCGKGQTVALLGSSGVGKSTITNALTGSESRTSGVRLGDAKGKHTTTSRSMHATTTGGWLIDTPGMRSLRLVDMREGLDILFQDIADLVEQCRFRDCNHETEPGCAIQSALSKGLLDQSRLQRWQKLGLEEQSNTESLAQSHKRSREMERIYNTGRQRGHAKRD